MVQILPQARSFGTEIARGLGSGISQGLSRSADFASQMGMEKFKQKQRRGLLDEIERGGQAKPVSEEDLSKQFLESLPEIENHLGRGLEPQELDQLWNAAKQMQTGQSGQSAGSENDPFMKAKKYAASGEHELARVASEEAKLKERRNEKFEERNFQLAKPTLDRARVLSEDLLNKENASSTMRDSISSGNLGMFSLDNLAELTGIEGLRTPEGAVFKTASKEYFLGNLSRVGSRGLNQMMERVILEMAPLIGRKTEANLAVMEIFDAENAVTKKEIELTNQIARDYREKHGTFPEDLSERVLKELRPFAIQQQKDTMRKIDSIKEQYSPKTKEGVLMRDPGGNLRRVSHKDIREAKSAGYRTER